MDEDVCRTKQWDTGVEEHSKQNKQRNKQTFLIKKICSPLTERNAEEIVNKAAKSIMVPGPGVCHKLHTGSSIGANN